MTPLHCALENGHTMAATLLLEMGANIEAVDQVNYRYELLILSL
jgi:ankyrin repeat protein